MRSTGPLHQPLAPPAAGVVTTSGRPRHGPRRRASRILPRGTALPDAAWRSRHDTVRAFLVALTAVAAVWAWATEPAPGVRAAAVVLVLACSGAVAVPVRHRRLAASAVSVAMLADTAVLVHLSGGLIEMHFLFFVIVGAVTVYRQWVPFLAAVAFVLLHHGVVGTLAPGSTYNHPAAIADPLGWAGIHGAFVALASVVGLAAWRFEESAREELHDADEDLRALSGEREAEREQVERLVASVRPTAVDVPGVRLAATYLPAAGALMGGDLYDWFVGPDGRVHVTVVDAMGKGVSATHQAVAVVHAVRVLALAGLGLEDLLARADEVLTRHDPDVAATVVVARYEPATGRLRVASAGHPPSLLVPRDGPVRYLESVGIGLGVPGAGSSVLVDVVLGAGDAVVLYTDGLVEGRRDVGRGLEALASTAVAVRGEDVEHLCERLALEPADSSDDDDRVVVVLRRDAGDP